MNIDVLKGSFAILEIPYIYFKPHNDDFWHSGGKSLLKTLWAKKKMLVTSILFFSHNVFYPIKDNFIILSNI